MKRELVTSIIAPAGRTATDSETGGRHEPTRKFGLRDAVLLSAWFGLVAGWLEVGTRVLLKHLVVTGQMYQMNRHFVWLVPLSNLLLFLVGGLLLASLLKLYPRRAQWLFARFLCAVALMPALVVAVPQIYAGAWLVVAIGIAVRVVPWLERLVCRSRLRTIGCIIGLLAPVPVVAGFVFGGDWLKSTREAARPLPAAGSPNVLLIILDTVRADRLSLYGYPRPTTPNLEWLARRGIRFDEARATAPWTLPSHASIFTGHWPHELHVSWKTSLQTQFPTLAEYLGSRGYATAGFVGNTQYCSYDAGLARGFTHYEDYPIDIEHLRPLRTAVLFERAWDGVSRLGMWLTDSRYGSVLHWFLDKSRKNAGSINREFLAWFERRPDPKRPFFTFLNYFDAHVPYLPPDGTRFHFGSGPRTLNDFLLLIESWKTVDKMTLSPHFAELVRDSYDNCLVYLDEQLGELFDALRKSGVLDNTVLIVTADHGEELGEHGLFEHGESLYRPEIHVPLLFCLPNRRGQAPVIVRETVSLRELPATIVDLANLADASPFPGQSLVRFWKDPALDAKPRDRLQTAAVSELSGPNPTNPSSGRSPAIRGALASVAQDDYVYIRNEGDGKEELYQERDDPSELFNRARDEALLPRLEQLRRTLEELTDHNR
jgi:arylsulfatase A-like enzyme